MKLCITYSCCLGLLVVSGIHCHKKFDAPPVYIGPEISANLSIRDLRSKQVSGSFGYITEDWIIEGIVIADDSKDNFYKSIVLQDSTGGITIRMDGFGLYADYPVGRRLAVKLKGLYLGDYARMVQLGGGVDWSDPRYPKLRPIPVPLFSRFIVKKALNQPVAVHRVRLDELGDSLQSCLVQLDQLEFAVTDTGKTYADAINKSSSNATVKSCSGGSAYVRTSGFSRFAGAKIPRGNGSIMAVYSVFGSSRQLLLRDTSDVQLTGLRCTAAGAKELLTEDFEQQQGQTVFSKPGWKNIAETGEQLFLVNTNLNNQYAEISAFATGKTALVSWLIAPPVNLANSANEILSFETRDGFDNGAVLQVLVSTNYDGGNTPWKAKWTPLKAIISKGTVSAVAAKWVSSGDIGLSGFSGNIFLAFRYEGADPANSNDARTTRFQLDNIRIRGN
jgi:hypothetical protein